MAYGLKKCFLTSINLKYYTYINHSTYLLFLNTLKTGPVYGCVTQAYSVHYY